MQNTTLTKTTEFHFTKTLTKHINRKQHIRKSWNLDSVNAVVPLCFPAASPSYKTSEGICLQKEKRNDKLKNVF